MPVELRVLGEVEVRSEGQLIPLGHARRRCVLAALVVDAGRPVPVDQLIDRVWGDRTPRDARNVLYSYLARLRRALAGAAGVAIEHRPGGYVLAIDPLGVDLYRFRHLVAKARTAADDRVALTLLSQALDLWHGQPFAGIDNRWLDTVRTALVQERLTAQLEHTDLRLRNGEHAQLLPELLARAAAHPLDERAAAQLMLAYHRAGRSADALRHYQDLRRLLVAELGTEPGPELRQLHQQVLSPEPARAAAPRAPTPRQLPGPPGRFTGRHEELQRLSDRAASGATLVITAIGGAGGIGKTWLALYWAHQHADEFPDGQLYVNLRGFDPTGPPTPPAVALRRFLEALGVDPALLAGELEELAALFRSLVAGKRMLVVADNARDTEQVTPLLPGSGTCTVLITSRSRLTGLATTHGARLLDLDVLPDADARRLLARQLGDDRLAAEPEAVDDLLATCAGLPLALGITASRAAQHPAFPLAMLAKDLHDTATRLDSLDAGDLHTNLRAVLSWSHRALDSRTATVFTLVGSAPGPDISLPAAAALTGLPLPQARTALRRLENASLLRQHLPGRYRMHDLTRLYAGEQAADDLPVSARHAALRRLVDFHLHTCYANDQLLQPFRDPIELDPPAPGCVPERLPDMAAALRWFDAEHACLLATHALAAELGWHTAVWQLAWTMNTFHERRGHSEESMACWRTALAAAEQLGDRGTLLLVRERLGRACSRAGRQHEALEILRRNLILAEAAGDVRMQALTYSNMGAPWELLDDDRQALLCSRRALELYRSIGDAIQETRTLSTIAWHLARIGDYDSALATSEQALAMARAHGYRNAEAALLDTLGYIAHHTGRHTEALHYYSQALQGFHELGGVHTEADIHAYLGDTYAALGQAAEANAAWLRALDFYRAQHRAEDAERVLVKLTTGALLPWRG
jgi:DNA-binding SARP family transcriptional activator